MDNYQEFLMLVQTAALNTEISRYRGLACQVLAEAMYIPNNAIPYQDFAKIAEMAKEFVYYDYNGDLKPNWLEDDWFPEEM